ncbi:MAG: hypothetical protein KIT74_11880 [Fimbriimonadales bacterium]|nr:hypothetical protein [Fimbriimonadales bacterium]
MRKTAFLFMTLVTTAASAQQKSTTGYATVNGLKMHYAVHGPDKPGSGNNSQRAFLLHGALTTININCYAQS